ncbi:hypothetical protein ACFE04_031310 [Oxalis oulophora]
MADSHFLYINCGGDNVKVNGTTYIGDAPANDGVATLYTHKDRWGFSSTGDFLEDNNELNTPNRFIASVTSSNIPELDSTARLSPLSLTYYGYCLRNGNYSVSLHFTEIQFTSGESFGALGWRAFDIYIQDKLVERNFDIEAEAHGFFLPITKIYNVTVANNTLEIRFCWAGKGTQGIPFYGVYGSLISAISVNPNFKPPSGTQTTKILVTAVGIVGSLLIFSAVGILWWKCHYKRKNSRKRDLRAAELQTISSYSLKQLKAATDNFDHANKIGEGGFGCVYKGLLSDGTVIAVKQLSSKSTQGNREFLNEMGMISCLQHPNLVKLFGCCTEGNQLLLVYEYLENNCLSRALFELAKDDEFVCLLERACHLLQNGSVLDLVDKTLKSKFDKEEAERMIKVALLCTAVTPSHRPTMTEVVRMLEGEVPVPKQVLESGNTSQDIRFKAIRDEHKQTSSQVTFSDSTDNCLLARYNTGNNTLTERQQGTRKSMA